MFGQQRQHKAAAAVQILTVAAILLLFAPSTASADHLKRFNELLVDAGIGAQLEPMSRRQVVLIDRLGEIYSKSNDLTQRERELLAEIGTSEPDGRAKNDLRAMYNLHLLAMNSAEKLARELREETDRVAGGATRAAESGADEPKLAKLKQVLVEGAAKQE